MKSLLFAVLGLLVTSLAINQHCDPLALPSSQTGVFQLVQACPVNAHCLQNGFCACNKGFIGDCSQPAQSMDDDVEVTSNLTHDKYTYFQVVGDSELYNLLSFTLCHDEASDLAESIDVWDDNGTLNTFTKDNAEPGGKDYSISKGCIILNTPFLKFSTQPNGQTEGFIMGIKLSMPGTVTVHLTVSITTLDFWGLMSRLLLIIGGCFVLTLSIAVAYLVYKWRRRQLFYLGANPNQDLSHFQEYMPAGKYSEVVKQFQGAEECAVCLAELGPECVVRRTVCGHIFHQDCLDQWCRAMLNCPICRRSFDAECLREEGSTLGSSQGGLRENIL